MWGRFIRDWINHTKEGASRTKEDLKNSDTIWKNLIQHIKEIERKSSPSKEEIYLVSQIKYVGKLTRIHQNFTSQHPFGIINSKHLLSWTSQEDLSQIYWISRTRQYLFITAEATEDNFGISLIGLQNYLDKYYYKNYSLGNPSIIKEQEVIFPLNFESILNIKIESVNDRDKKI